MAFPKKCCNHLVHAAPDPQEHHRRRRRPGSAREVDSRLVVSWFTSEEIWLMYVDVVNPIVMSKKPTIWRWPLQPIYGNIGNGCRSKHMNGYW